MPKWIPLRKGGRIHRSRREVVRFQAAGTMLRVPEDSCSSHNRDRFRSRGGCHGGAGYCSVCPDHHRRNAGCCREHMPDIHQDQAGRSSARVFPGDHCGTHPRVPVWANAVSEFPAGSAVENSREQSDRTSVPGNG